VIQLNILHELLTVHHEEFIEVREEFMKVH
jgi:hypothetical protein